jgi:hypothetical protein
LFLLIFPTQARVLVFWLGFQRLSWSKFGFLW